MTTVSALYFPDLQPPNPVAALTGLFSPLRCYRLEQAAPSGLPQDPGPTKQLLGGPGDHRQHQGLPAAVAERIDLPRLGKLLAELEERSGQDALLFGQGILAQLSEQRQESASELVAPLLGFPDDPAAGREREILWRALLLLKLAEIQGRREAELNAELQGFEERRATLFRQLRGDEEDGGDEENGGDEADGGREGEGEDGGRAATATIAPTPKPIIQLRPPERNSALLLKAWGQLFLRDREETELLLSADPAAVTILLESYSALTGREPQNLGTMPLPTGPEPATNELAPALRQAAELGDGQAAAKLLAEASKKQQEQQPRQPAGHHPLQLQFFLLPGTSLPELLAHFCRHPPAPPTENGRRSHPHGLLALLTQ